MSKVDLRGLELTTMHTARMGRMAPPDHVVLASECPGACPDTGIAETVGRLLISVARTAIRAPDPLTSANE